MSAGGRRRGRSVASFVLLVLALLAAGGAWWVLRAEPAAGAAAAQPVVRDGELVDARTGDPWVPRGVVWSSFESACAQGWGFSALDTVAGDPYDDQAATLASWGVDTVRLPLNQDCWLGTRGAPVSDDFTSRTPGGYRSAVDSFVAALNAHGMVVVLDLRSRKRIGSPEFGEVAMPDSESLAFWRSVAGQYAGRPSVLFDAFDAPSSRVDATGRTVLELSWECWRDGGCRAPFEDDRSLTKPDGPTYDAQGMGDVVETIRRAGAQQPILLSGLDRGTDLSRWAEFAPDDDQLVAAFHASDLQGCERRCWDRVVAPLADRVPVLTTELGATDPLDGWVVDYLRWAEDHGIGSLVWVWSERPGDPQALVTDLDGEPTAWGALARRWFEGGTEGL